MNETFRPCPFLLRQEMKDNLDSAFVLWHPELLCVYAFRIYAFQFYRTKVHQCPVWNISKTIRNRSKKKESLDCTISKQMVKISMNGYQIESSISFKEIEYNLRIEVIPKIAKFKFQQHKGILFVSTTWFKVTWTFVTSYDKVFQKLGIPKHLRSSFKVYLDWSTLTRSKNAIVVNIKYYREL